MTSKHNSENSQQQAIETEEQLHMSVFVLCVPFNSPSLAHCVLEATIAPCYVNVTDQLSLSQPEHELQSCLTNVLVLFSYNVG